MEQIKLDIKPVDVPKSRKPSPRQSVTKHNRLIKTITPLDLTTQRILAAIVSAINPCKKLGDGETFRIRFDVNELAQLCQMHPTNIKRFLTANKDKGSEDNANNVSEKIKIEANIKKNVLDLQKIVVEVPTEEKEAPQGSMTVVSFFYEIAYTPSPLSITCTIHPKLLPYIHDFEGHFTSYRLSYFTSLTSKYTTRLYEVLSVGARWGSLTLYVWEPTEPDRSLYALLGLVDRAGTPQKGYQNTYSRFREKILEPGLAEINKLTDLKVTLSKAARSGRKVHSLTFDIVQQRRDPGVVARLKKIGITEKTAVRLSKEHTEDLLKAVCDITEEAIENFVDIENPLKYVRHLLKLKIDELPETLNPFSDAYKRNPTAQRFLSTYVIPAYFKVEAAARQGVADLALEHPAIGPEFRLYSKLAEENRGGEYDCSVRELVQNINAERWLQS